jgi:glycerophosphoryl diester phosphodiesterase
MVLKIAHRGLKSSGKENSLYAINQAIANNFDAVEIDIRKTKDNKIILFHNPYVFINNIKVYLDSVYHSLISNQVQLLNDVLRNIKVNSISIFFDIKKCKDDKYFLYNILNIIQVFINKGWDQNKFYFQSFYAPYIQIISHFDKIVSNYGIIYEGLPLNSYTDLYKLKCNYVCLNHESIDEKDIKDIQKNTTLQIFLYTINDNKIYHIYKNLNIDGIITDTPTVFINSL